MKKQLKKIINLALVAIIGTTILTGCSNTKNDKSSEEKTSIKLGAMATTAPILEFVKEGMEPMGYNVEVVMFDANNMPAIATKDGDIDGLVHNHNVWLKTFNEENKSDLLMIEPYIGYYRTAMYSSKWNSVEELPDNAIIAVPNDPANMNNNLIMLQDLELITLGEKKDNFYTVLDIVDNPKNITLLETEISTTARSIVDADAVIAPATRIKSAGIDPNKFLAEDETTVNFPIGLTVRSEDKELQWVKDAMEVIQSDEFKEKFQKEYDGTILMYD